MAGCAFLIAISMSVGAKPEPLAKLFFFLHHHASGFQVGFLFLVQAECRLWAKEQYCVQKAGKKLHVLTFTSYYAMQLPLASVSKKV